MADDPTEATNSHQAVIASSLHYGLEGIRDPRVAIAVDLLSQGKTLGEVAVALGIDRSTLWDLRQQHRIDEIVAELAMEVVQAGHRRNLAVYREAMDAVVEVMRTAEKPSERLAAAKELITHIRQDARVAAFAQSRGVDLERASVADLEAVLAGGSEG